jgi:adenine-specific DNA-methyltransferase
MPSLQFKGKNIIWNHHQSPLLPTHTLDLNKELSYNPKNANGNCIVEGDNLLALKALLPEYQGKVDCIYIDPPYNTGNEGWVYNDKVNSPMINEWIGQTVGKEAEDFTRHDKWLCMMTPRLKLLHEMLSDKGVIFVSIDDNEQANLKLLMDEIFGAENFIACFVWRRRTSSAMSQNMCSVDHEYVICYQNKPNYKFLGNDKSYESYTNTDNDPNGEWTLGDLTVGMGKNERPNQFYDLIDTKTGNIFKANPNRVWAYIPESMQKKIEEGRVFFPTDTTKKPMLKRYKIDLQSEFNPISTWIDSIKSKSDGIISGLNTEATKELQDIFGENVFNYAKPKSLVKSILKASTSKSSIVMDSFAGSGTTAQAVLELNKEDGGNRQFVLVQMPEEIKPETPAGKYCVENNLPLVVSSITRERVRLASEKKINPVVVDKGELEGLEVKRQEIGFEYYNLGTPLDSWSIISSQSSAELPSFGKLASYIWRNLTGEKREFIPSNIDSVNKFHLGDYKGEKVFLLYEQDLPKLNGRELCMSLPIAKELEELYPNCPKLIYAPTCYLDDWHREKYQIRYINFPFGM